MRKHAGWSSWAVVAVGALASAPAAADVYTWLDAAGNTHVSNLAPPAGARVTAVAHESASAIARADAARKAAQDAEMRALADRVAELEHAAAQPRFVPAPPYAALPPYAPPPPSAPAPQFVVTMMPAGADEPPAAAPCAWVGCALPVGPALYGAPIVVVSNGFSRRGRATHRPRVAAPAPAAHVAPPVTLPPRIPRRG